MPLTAITTALIFRYVDQKRIFNPQDGSSGLNIKNRALSMTLWDLKSEFQLPWDERTSTVDYLDSVVEYTAPDGLDHLIRVTPQDVALRLDHKSPEEFLRLHYGGVTNMTAVGIQNRAKTLFLKFRGRHTAIGVNSASGRTTNGTWTADTSGSDATNVTTDTTTYRKHSGSVNFDVDVSQSSNNFAQISNSTMSQVDLSDEESLAHFLLEFYIPSVTNISSCTLRWGNDASNYWERTVTTNVNGGALANGWNTLDFFWGDATQTGTVDETAIDYILFRVTYTASQADDTDFRINDIRAVVAESVDIRFSTAYIATNASGTLIDEITATSDVMLFSTVDTKFLNAVIAGCLFQLFGDTYTDDGRKENEWETRYQRAKELLREEYPPRIRTPEQRVKIRSTQSSGTFVSTL